LDAKGAAVNLNASSNFATNINTGSSTGTITLGGSGTQSIAIGDNAAGAKAITIGNAIPNSSISLKSGGAGTIGLTSSLTAAVDINAGTGTATPVNIGTGSTTGTVTIGNSTGNVNLPKLNASLPVKTDASKNLTTGAINLASSTEVTGTLPINNLPAGAMILISATESDVWGTTASTAAVSYPLAANTYSRIMVEVDVTLEQAGGNNADWSFALKYGGTTKESIPLRAQGSSASHAHDIGAVVKYSEAFAAGGNITVDVIATSANGTWYIRGFRVYGIK
jgi:hypothetical protein